MSFKRSLFFRSIIFIITVTFISSCSFVPENNRDISSLYDDNIEKKKIQPNPKKSQVKKHSLEKTLIEQKIVSIGINHWWKNLNDKHLDATINRLLNSDLNINVASKRILQASNLYPLEHVPLISKITTSHSSDKNLITKKPNVFLAPSWQINLYEKVRKSANSALNASSYDKIAITHTFIAELINTRIAIASYNKLLKLAAYTRNNRKSFYDLLKKRYDLGYGNISLSDLFLAEQNYISVKEDINEYNILLAAEVNKYAILLGLKPSKLNLDLTRFSVPKIKSEVPKNVPAKLLDRRPDLMSSELRIIASHSEIAVNIADLFPSLSISGNFGYKTHDASMLFVSNNLIDSILNSILLRIFEVGVVKPNIKLNKSKARELADIYAENILNAFKEVEIALVEEKTTELEQNSAMVSLKALKRYESSAERRYNRGIENLRTLLDVKNKRYLAEKSLINIKQLRFHKRVSLYLALAGDWK